MSIPKHHRQNHENTTSQLLDLSGIIMSLEYIVYENTDNSRISSMASTLIRLAEDKMKQVERSHAKEWVGLGGTSDELSHEEVAAAKGEVPS